MYVLWAKKRAINGKGFILEKIKEFYRYEEINYLLADLDNSIYEEALVMEGDKCIFYREYEKPYTLKRINLHDEQ